MNKTKIDWADYSWNPVTGCLHTCEYCYARKMSVRFSGDIRLNKSDERCVKLKDDLYILEKPFIARGEKPISYPFGFKPTLHKYRLNELSKIKNGANVFVGSMADLFGEWVPEEWIEMVFEVCKQNPRHNFLFLTKNPARYMALAEKNRLPNQKNMWYGTTVTDGSQKYFSVSEYNCFLSIEPILSAFALERELEFIKWVIIGAETGRNKNKKIPKKEWIVDIDLICIKSEIPVFMKESLRGLMKDDFKQEVPNNLLNKALSEKKHKILFEKCSVCKKEYRKSEMIALLAREQRGATAYKYGYVCVNCNPILRNKFEGETEICL